MANVSTIAFGSLNRMQMTIGRVAMAVALTTASTMAHAQQVADPSLGVSPPVTAAPSSAPKKTLEEKAAMATALLAAGFAAFRAIKSATQAPAAQTLPPPPPQATVK